MRALSDKPAPSRALIADLLSPGFVRWTPRRKLGVLKALDHALLAPDDACRRYGLTPREIEECRGGFRCHGPAGRKTTTLRHRGSAASIRALPR